MTSTKGLFGRPTYLGKSGNLTLTDAHYGRLINVTSTGTITLPDAATVGSGWFCRVRQGGGAATVARAGSDTIELWADSGLTSVLLASQGDEIEIVSTGSGWVASGRIKVRAIMSSSTDQTIATATLTTLTFSTAATDTHSMFENSTAEKYEVPFSGVYYVQYDGVVDGSASFSFTTSIVTTVGINAAFVSQASASIADTEMHALATVQLTRGDEIWLTAYQVSGGGKDIQNMTELCFWEVLRVG
ncbi:MAG: hypothetical protein HQ483_18405 [Rhodospirillales bacterium]|nr:hypothetical protein [Rhodospirillales bacterium]